jgi:hypothetical protein
MDKLHGKALMNKQKVHNQAATEAQFICELGEMKCRAQTHAAFRGGPISPEERRVCPYDDLLTVFSAACTFEYVSCFVAFFTFVAFAVVAEVATAAPAGPMRAASWSRKLPLE